MLPSVKSTIHTYKTFSGKNLQYRPFKVKDEQVLQEAKESEDSNLIARTVLDVIKGCLIKPGSEKLLPSFDVFRLLLHIKAASGGNIVKPRFHCEACEKPNGVDINLFDVAIKSKKEMEPRVFVGLDNDTGEDIHLNLKYPSLHDMLDQSDRSALAFYVDSVSSGENYTDLSEVSAEDVEAWVKEQEASVLVGLKEYIDNSPHLHYEVDFNCNCGKHNKFTLNKVEDFFM